jgi:hypothetical protein
MKNILLLIIIGFSLLQSCAEKEFKTPTDFIIIKVEKDSIIADDFSLCKIEIKLSNPSYKEKIKTATLKSNLGSLLSSSVNFDSEGNAIAYIKSPNSGIATLEVTCNDISFYKEIHFVASFPQYIIVNTASSSSNKIDQKIDISVDLIRDKGSVSNDFNVHYYAYDKSNKIIGHFSNIKPINQDKKATAEFWLQDTTYTGYIQIQSKVFNLNDTIEGTSKILITIPL